MVSNQVRPCKSCEVTHFVFARLGSPAFEGLLKIGNEMSLPGLQYTWEKDSVSLFEQRLSKTIILYKRVLLLFASKRPQIAPEGTQSNSNF